MKVKKLFGVGLFGLGLCIAASVSASEAELLERVEKLEKAAEASAESVIGEWAEKITLSGAVEVEAGLADKNDDWEDEDSNDVDLAAADLGVDIQVADWATGHAVFSWDCEDDNNVGVDEADITLGGTEEIPGYLKAGRLYVPFGNYETSMISDPLTLEIGEIRDGAIQAGVDISGFYGAVYAFNGEVDADGEDDEVRCFGLNAGYAMENDRMSLDAGLGYVNNILESGMGDLLEGDLKDYAGGFACHAIAGFGPLGVIVEYVAALDEIESTDGWAHDEPSAWNLEVGFTFEASEKEITLAAAYQGTKECGGFLPESRILGSAGVGLADGLGLAAEYAHSRDYDEDDGGSGENANAVTLQLALEF